MFKEETERPDGGYLIPCLSALSPKPKTHPNVNRKPQKKTFCHIPVQTEKKTDVLAEGIYVFLKKRKTRKEKLKLLPNTFRERETDRHGMFGKRAEAGERHALYGRV